MRLSLNKIKKVIFNESGQAMTEYVLTLVLLVVATIPAIKLIPLAFGAAFDKITNYYSLHMGDLVQKVENLIHR